MPTILFLSILLICCSATTNQKKQVITGGTNNSQIMDSIFVSFETDGSLPISFGYYDSNFNYSFIRLLKGGYEKDVHYFINTKKQILYNNAGTNCPFILYAGDSVKVLVSKKILRVTSLTTKERSNELNFFSQLLFNKKITSIGSLSPERNKIISSSTKYSLATNNILEANKIDLSNFLLEYSKQYNLSETFKRDVNTLIQFEHITNLLVPIIEKPYNPNKYEKDFIKILNSHQFDFLDSTNLYNHTFRFALYQYNKFLSRDSLNTNNSFDKQYKSANANFKGGCKNYLLYELMKTAYYKDKRIFNQYFKTFKDDCQNEILKESIYVIAKSEGKLESSSNELKTETEQLVSFESILKNNTSKIILVDFWASWCLPCIKSLNEFDEIQAHYKGKPISFVFISLDNNESSWKKQTTKYNNFMDASNSYLLLNDFNSSICNKYRITTIPRYIVFDENRNVLSLNFNTQNHYEMYKQLDKWLYKNIQ